MAKEPIKKPDVEAEKKENPFAKKVDKKAKEAPEAKDKDEDPTEKKAPETAKNKIDTEPTTNEGVNFIMSGDLSDLEEHKAIVEEFLAEDLNQTQRNHKAAIFSRYRAKIDNARKRSINRQASLDTLKGRARKQVINHMKQRLLNKKGIQFDTATASDKNRVERILKKRKAMIDRLVNSSLKNVRQLQKSRLSTKNEAVEVDLVEQFNKVYDSVVTE